MYSNPWFYISQFYFYENSSIFHYPKLCFSCIPIDLCALKLFSRYIHCQTMKHNEKKQWGKLQTGENNKVRPQRIEQRAVDGRSVPIRDGHFLIWTNQIAPFALRPCEWAWLYAHSVYEQSPLGLLAWMVACAAVSQSQVLLAVPMTACTLSIEHLKEKLLSAVENVRNLVRGAELSCKINTTQQKNVCLIVFCDIKLRINEFSHVSNLFLCQIFWQL